MPEAEKRPRFQKADNDTNQPYWFWICECGKHCGGNAHGHFRINGVRSDPFMTKKAGQDILLEALEKKLLTTQQAAVFEDVLHMSALPDRVGD